ncbi:MAG: hypothetical protein Q9166_006801 [cf. Caloplaca sp. 2 TL-2023]
MDGISGPASILAIAAAGLQISIKLISFANQISNGQERIRYIGTDVSITAGILQQLGELMKKSPGDNDERTTIFSKEGLITTKAAADACQGVFGALEGALRKASRQLRRRVIAPGEVIFLSKTELLRWPFLQSNFDALRQELNNSRATLMLILQITTLAYSKKMAELNNVSIMSREEQEIFVKSIISQHKTETQQPPPEHVPPHQAIDGHQEASFPLNRHRPPNPPRFKFIAEGLPGQTHHNSSVDRDHLDHHEIGCLRGNPDNPSFKRTRSELASETPELQEDVKHKKLRLSRGTTPSPLNDLITTFKAGNDLKVWNMQPVVHPVYCGYDLRWSLAHLPIPVHRAQRVMQSLLPKNSDAVKEQLGRISIKEREFLKAFVIGQLPDGCGDHEENEAYHAQNMDLLNVIVKQGQIINNGFGEIGNRSITILTQVDRSQPMPLRNKLPALRTGNVCRQSARPPTEPAELPLSVDTSLAPPHLLQQTQMQPYQKRFWSQPHQSDPHGFSSATPPAHHNSPSVSSTSPSQAQSIATATASGQEPGYDHFDSGYGGSKSFATKSVRSADHMDQSPSCQGVVGDLHLNYSFPDGNFPDPSARNVTFPNLHSASMGSSNYAPSWPASAFNLNGCYHVDCFSTNNDSDSRKKSVHKIMPNNSTDRSFRCAAINCPKREKTWPRLDNFRQHCLRIHSEEELDELIRKSELDPGFEAEAIEMANSSNHNAGNTGPAPDIGSPTEHLNQGVYSGCAMSVMPFRKRAKPRYCKAPSPFSPEISPENITDSLDSASEESESMTYGDEGMMIIEEYLAKFTTLGEM